MEENPESLSDDESGIECATSNDIKIEQDESMD